MAWDVHNRAHLILCAFEKRLKNQRLVPFPEVGEWGIEYIIGATAGESPKERLNKAHFHATQLDEAFTNIYDASYETGVASEHAIARMVTVLADSSKKLKDLGGPVDSAYRFHGEVTDAN